MSEISDLKQRVEAVGQKFGRLAEQGSSYGERLTGLLNAVEEGFARSQRELKATKAELEDAKAEIRTLTDQLDGAKDEARQRGDELEAVKEDVRQRSSELEAARDEVRQRGTELEGARDESKQLRGMLLALLEAVESGGSLDLGETMRTLESRIDRIVSTTDAGFDTAPRETVREAPVEAAPVEAVPVEAVPAEAAPGDPPAAPPEPETGQEATPEVASEPEAEPLAAAEAVPVPDEVGPEEILASVVEAEAPSEPAGARPSGDGDRLDRKTAEPPSDDDLSAVNKIIQRISLLTGEFVEPSQKQAGSGEDGSLPPVKIGNGSVETGSGKSEAPRKDESAAKSP